MIVSILFIIGVLFIGLNQIPYINIQGRWLIIMGLFILFLAYVGQRITSQDGKSGGRWEGCLIDNRKKISLSRLQILLWTVLVLSAWSIIALHRCQLMWSGKMESSADILNIQIPEYLLLAMGISTTSLAGSTLIKNNKNTKRETEKSIAVIKAKIEAEEKVIDEKIKEIEAINKKLFDIETIENIIKTFYDSLEPSPNSMNLSSLDDDFWTKKLGLKKEDIEKNQTINTIRKSIETIQKYNSQSALEEERKEYLSTLKSRLESDKNADDALKAQLKAYKADEDLSNPKTVAKSLIDIKKEAEEARKKAEKNVEEYKKNEEIAQGAVAINPTIADASWSDLFRGDLISNLKEADLSKVQMFFFTLVLVFTYGTAIWGLLGYNELLSGKNVNLPDFSSSMVQILGISHAGYLTIKQLSN